jgi:hypothetical protein
MGASVWRWAPGAALWRRGCSIAAAVRAVPPGAARSERGVAGRGQAPALSDGQGLAAHAWPRPGALAARLHRGGACGGLARGLWGVAPCGIAARAVVAGARGPHRGLGPHAPASPDARAWRPRRPLPAPRASQAAAATGGQRVPGAPGGAPAGPPPVVPGPPAPARAGGGAGATAPPLGGPRHCPRWASHRRAGAARGPRPDDGGGCRPCRAPAASPQPPGRPSPPRPRAAAVPEARLPPSARKPTGVSHRMSASLQPDPVAPSRPAGWPMGGGSGGWHSPHTRLVAHCPKPHLGRLALSGDTFHHIMRWNVEC